MRLTSDFWVSALLREARAAGGFAYLARHGAEEAGAIFIKQNKAGGEAALYGPAPQIFYDEATEIGGRLFMQILSGAEADIAARISRELNFDPDIWLVEIDNLADLSRIEAIKLVKAEDAD